MSFFKPIYKLRDCIDSNKLVWKSLSENFNAIHLLELNPDNINWENLSKNPNAIHLLEQNLDKIDWYYLSRNHNAIKLLEQNPDKINWYELSRNQSIFKLDTNLMKLQIKDFAEDLAKACFHPKRVERYLEEYDYEL